MLEFELDVVRLYDLPKICGFLQDPLDMLCDTHSGEMQKNPILGTPNMSSSDENPLKNIASWTGKFDLLESNIITNELILESHCKALSTVRRENRAFNLFQDLVDEIGDIRSFNELAEIDIRNFVHRIMVMMNKLNSRKNKAAIKRAKNELNFPKSSDITFWKLYTTTIQEKTISNVFDFVGKTIRDKIYNYAPHYIELRTLAHELARTPIRKEPLLFMTKLVYEQERLDRVFGRINGIGSESILYALAYLWHKRGFNILYIGYVINKLYNSCSWGVLLSDHKVSWHCGNEIGKEEIMRSLAESISIALDDFMHVNRAYLLHDFCEIINPRFIPFAIRSQHQIIILGIEWENINTNFRELNLGSWNPIEFASLIAMDALKMSGFRYQESRFITTEKSNGKIVATLY